MSPSRDGHKDVASNKTFRGTRWANDDHHCGMCGPFRRSPQIALLRLLEQQQQQHKYTGPLEAVTSHCRKTTVPQCYETHIALTGHFGKSCRILPIMRKHIRRACGHRSQMNPVQTPSKSNSPFLKPFLHSMRPDPHPHVPTHTSRKRMVVAAQRSGNTCPARTRITNDMRKRTAQRRRSAHLKGCGPPQQSQPIARITLARKVTRGALPPLLPFMPTEEAAATRNRQHTPQKKHPNPLQCASCACVVVCACRHTRQRSKNRSRACGGDAQTKMYSRSAWQK
ncbi:hypothetical protein TcCL_Unassigned01976 [Trypanosoma cruzi]|nr:hypothetical protein TcCL_Unassigned01976 [Trypanosoma cruzi]